MIRLHCGDCLDVMPTLDGPFDMILADLPYGTTACKWDTVIPFKPLWEQYKRLIKPKGAIVLFGSQPFTTKAIASNYTGYRHTYTWIKSRPTGFQRVAIEPLRQTEDVIVFSSRKHINDTNCVEKTGTVKDLLRTYLVQSGYTQNQLNDLCGFEASGYLRKTSSWANVLPDNEKLEVILGVLECDKDFHDKVIEARDSIGPFTYNPQGITVSHKVNKRNSAGSNWSNMRRNEYQQEFENYPSNILSFAGEPKPIHPTQKPVALLEYLVRTYTDEGEVVLDNTMGSGTTGVACMNTGRSFVGIELLSEYYEIAETRIEQAQTEMVQAPLLEGIP